MIECQICVEECMRKDFFSHNNKDCFLKDAENIFCFPIKSCFYLIQEGPTQQEVLVEVSYVKNEDENWMIDCVGFTVFEVKTSHGGLAMPTKMKVVVEDADEPSFKLEVVTSIGQTLYTLREKIEDCNVVLADKKGKKLVR